jgi:hypothetical protein
MLSRVVPVKTHISEERSTYITRVRRIGELGTTLAVTSNRSSLQRNTANVVPTSPIHVSLVMKALRSSLTPVLTKYTRHNIPEDGILHSHRRENLKSYIIFLFP